jgi:membrane protein
MVIALSLLFVLALTASAWANPACAVCTVAVGASLEIARQLGVDDSVVGVWAGAMLAIIGFWTIRWFERKGWNFKGRDWTLIIVSVAMIGFMYISEIKYTPQVIGIFYLDPFLFSTVLGALVMVWSSDFYQWMKARNGGHAHFPFEKVAVPVVALLLVSVYFYYYPLTRKAADLGADLYTF